MTDGEWVLAVLVVVLLGAWLVGWWVVRQETVRASGDREVLAAVALGVEEVRAAVEAGRRRREQVAVRGPEVVRLVDEWGQGLGTVSVGRRGAAMTVRGSDGVVTQVVASHRGADGVWVYRRVGVERPAG